MSFSQNTQNNSILQTQYSTNILFILYIEKKNEKKSKYSMEKTLEQTLYYTVSCQLSISIVDPFVLGCRIGSYAQFFLVRTLDGDSCKQEKTATVPCGQTQLYNY